MSGRKDCHQCRGRGWVMIQHKKVTCTCVVLAKLNKDDRERGPIPSVENHGRGYGGRGSVTTIVTKGGPAAISQSCGDFIVSMTKAVIEDG